MTEQIVDEWKKIYDYANIFETLAPWEWMRDSDVFGIRNPQNNEIGYCCVMGRNREFFALAVYLGSEGLEGYKKIQTGEAESLDQASLLNLQKCLIVSFGSKSELEKEDRTMLEKVGLKFKKNRWPQFRNYMPGYGPWFLTKDEVIYLTLVFQEALKVCVSFREDANLLRSHGEGKYLVREPKNSSSAEWIETWCEPSPIEKICPKEEPVDEKRLEDIRKRSSESDHEWEIDFFYSMASVKEKEARPYYPHITLCVERRSGFVIGMNAARPNEYGKKFVDCFLSAIEKTKSIPHTIYVKQIEAQELLEQYVVKLGIKIIKTENLPALEPAQKSLLAHLTRN